MVEPRYEKSADENKFSPSLTPTGMAPLSSISGTIEAIRVINFAFPLKRVIKNSTIFSIILLIILYKDKKKQLF